MINGTSANPLFSIIIPTRNRSSTFEVALKSVLEQRFGNFEIIVVNDGSSSEHQRHYQYLVGRAQGLVKMLTLVPAEMGHGQSYGLNYGASHAQGDYLCFLDDDDQWIDPTYLGRAAAVVTGSGDPVDLILANQQAFRDGTPVPGYTWIEDLDDRLHRAPDTNGAYPVTPSELLTCPAHCHVNTTIVSRTLYRNIGGFDEGLRYECDRDFFLRAIDVARVIKHIALTVSRHNIPDPAARGSMSTGLSELAKRLYQLRVFDKAILFSRRPELKRYAMRERAYILKHIAIEASRSGQLQCAAYYAREALVLKPTIGWLGLSALFALRSWLPLLSRFRRVAHGSFS